MFALRRTIFTSRFFSTAIAKSMEKHGVVPDVIDVAPAQVVEVNNNKSIIKNSGLHFISYNTTDYIFNMF